MLHRPSAIAHYRSLAQFALAALLVMSIARLLLMLAYHDRVDAVEGFGFILLHGARFDIAMLSMLLAIPLLLTHMLALHAKLAATWQKGLQFILPATFSAIVFMEIATPAFITEYGSRPNYLFFEYLEYPREVFGMLVHAYLPHLLVAVFLVPLSGWLLAAIMRKRNVQSAPLAYWQVAILVSISIPLLTLGIRSTTDHRPINPSTAAFSQDPLVNSLAMNSSYSAAYALYERRREDAFRKTKLDISENKLIATMRASIGESENAPNQAIPTLHHQLPARPESTRHNLVIIVEESLGAEFVGALGGLELTPQLDKLAEQGIWFENLYATGTRSVQGLEALVTGFLPTRASSVVKLGGSQDDFFTLAELLRRHGYTTSFLYGGDSDFDNMRRFFMNNGFETVIDEEDFDSPSFRSSWGVSDEDVFSLAHDRFSRHDNSQPFFSLIFTTSNHSPFEIPAGKIHPADPGENTVSNAVQYADYALGKFIAQARQSSYWKNTIFLVVADHNSRVLGAELVPIERFHIPALILGSEIEPRRIDQLASQVDLLPTLLSVAGLEVDHPAIGRDLLRTDYPQPYGIVMRYHDKLAYRENDSIVIQKPDLQLEQFRYSSGSLDPAKEYDNDLAFRAKVHFQWPVYAYVRKNYRLP